ncbi:uncharacterized protein LOC116132762 [Pistacia vera]|uniref:uncharacterized protein LOC116132762 n=1 Tax=Pistacia vera TaxID=55513 RepID=UPI001263D823|nr:uncharacterized protein LOC116132762 [Pistacia vera]
MGCGKSKHDVATGNTIARKKSNVGDQSKKTKDIETVLENGTKNNEITKSSLVQQQEGDNNQNVNSHNVGGDNPVAEVRDIAENKALNEGDHKEKQGGVVDQEKHEPDERLISEESPNHYFSSRKEEEAVDGIVSEQKSDYDSPRLEAVKERLFNDNERVDNAVEATSLDEQKQGETKTAVVKEENSAKEAEVSTPTTDSVEKNQNAEKEQSVASPTKDLKTV